MKGTFRLLGWAGALAAVSLLPGCVMLPVPHDDWLSPQFEGTVVDAATYQPLRGVKVTLSNYHYLEEQIGPVTTYSDERGHYSILAHRHSNWIVIIAGPADAFESPHIRFELAGYQSAEVVRNSIKGGHDTIREDVELHRNLP